MYGGKRGKNTAGQTYQVHHTTNTPQESNILAHCEIKISVKWAKTCKNWKERGLL
jgi:hypothetical protein